MVVGASRDPDHPLALAIFKTLSYADVFGYPLTVGETHTFLVGAQATREEIIEALGSSVWLRERVLCRGGYLTLAGREANFDLRQERAGISRRLQETARRTAVYLAALPFVRAVILTGSLAVENSRTHADDIDFLLVTDPGRLWLARLAAVAVVRLARVRGVLLCPNYLMTSERLSLASRSLFTAHELAQMVPLYGDEMYERLLRANQWAKAYLPNAFDRPAAAQIALPGWAGWGKRLAEWAFSGYLGDALEAREMRRKVHKLGAQAEARGAQETCFDAHCCKGHFHDYGVRTDGAYRQRLAGLGLEVDAVGPEGGE